MQKMGDGENLLWGVDMEVYLFHAMRGHKPVGMQELYALCTRNFCKIISYILYNMPFFKKQNVVSSLDWLE